MARIAEVTLKSGASVTMHTRLTMQEMFTAQERGQQRRKRKPPLAGLAMLWAGITDWVTGWTLVNPEDDSPLPFTEQGLGQADARDVNEISGLLQNLAERGDPNASSGRSQGT